MPERGCHRPPRARHSLRSRSACSRVGSRRAPRSRVTGPLSRPFVPRCRGLQAGSVRAARSTPSCAAGWPPRRWNPRPPPAAARSSGDSVSTSPACPRALRKRGDSSTTPAPGRTRGSSTACSPPPTTASAWLRSGWTPPAMRTRPGSPRTFHDRCGTTGTGSSRRSIRTCPSTGSRSSSSPATCCPTPHSRRRSPRAFIGTPCRPSARIRRKRSFGSRESSTASTPRVASGSASQSPARNATTTSTIPSASASTTGSSRSSTTFPTTARDSRCMARACLRTLTPAP